MVPYFHPSVCNRAARNKKDHQQEEIASYFDGILHPDGNLLLAVLPSEVESFLLA